MTKTEQTLIDMARGNGGTWGFETCYGRGAYGGRVNSGARMRNALFKLEKAGLVAIVDRQPWQDYNRGYGQGGTVFTYQLLQA